MHAVISRSCSICAADSESITSRGPPPRDRVLMPGCVANRRRSGERSLPVCPAGTGCVRRNPRFTSRVTTWESRGRVELVCARECCHPQGVVGCLGQHRQDHVFEVADPGVALQLTVQRTRQQFDHADEPQPGLLLCWGEPSGLAIGHGYPPALAGDFDAVEPRVVEPEDPAVVPLGQDRSGGAGRSGNAGRRRWGRRSGPGRARARACVCRRPGCSRCSSPCDGDNRRH